MGQSSRFRKIFFVLVVVVATGILCLLHVITPSILRTQIYMPLDIYGVKTAAWIKNLSGRNDIVSSFNVYQMNRNVTRPPPYQDPKFLQLCPLKHNVRNTAFYLMKTWITIAATHNITWFLTCASNLGSLRHRDIIPWDHDLDIGVFDVHEALIRRLAVKKRSTMNRSRPNLVTRVKDFCPKNNWDRLNCQDKMVRYHVDSCSFCGPLARLVYQHMFMDVYMLRTDQKNGQVVFRDESFNSPPSIPMSTYFPLQYCKFMGLTVPCANKREEYAKVLYRDLRPLKVCNGTKWKSVKYKN